MIPDHYEALGVQPGASPEQLRAAYRRLMREHHPDLRHGDRAAEETARRINAAWEVLRDTSKRAAYDRLRTVRAGSVEQTAVAVVQRDPSAGVTMVTAKSRPYSDERRTYREDFHQACLRVGVLTLFVGLLLLLAVR